MLSKDKTKTVTKNGGTKTKTVTKTGGTKTKIKEVKKRNQELGTITKRTSVSKEKLPSGNKKVSKTTYTVGGSTNLMVKEKQKAPIQYGGNSKSKSTSYNFVKKAFRKK